MNKIKVGLIGDFNPEVTAHKAIPLALNISSKKAGVEVCPVWVATDSIKNEENLSGYEALWCVPASPYKSMEGALTGIKYAREHKIPFLGTCGGFQHAVIEYFRNVLQMKEAGHTEINPDAAQPIIIQLSCSLIEKNGTIFFKEESFISKIYGAGSAEETYHCSYGFNSDYLNLLRKSNLRISGKDAEGGVRTLELQNHPFFVLTLFQPERSGLIGKDHPLINAFISAILKINKEAVVQ
ncbi:MAG: glutamine amidotransferase-related protein [Ignavibacteria bacterium]